MLITKTMNKTEDSIIILFKLKETINKYVGAFYDLIKMESWINTVQKDNQENIKILKKSVDTLYNLLRGEIIIRACSYKDEWNNQFAKNILEKDKQRMEVIKKICQPAWDRINEWTEMVEFRNVSLAHNFRLERPKRNFINIYNLTEKRYLKIPNHVNELMLLYECINLITSSVICEFYEEFETAKSLIKIEDNIESVPIDNVKELNEIGSKMMLIIEQYPDFLERAKINGNKLKENKKLKPITN